MKMQVTKTVDEEIDIEFPFFATDKYNTHVVKATEESIVKVYSNTIISYEKDNQHSAYSSEVYNAYNAPRATQDQFDEKFIEAIENIEKLAGVDAFSHLNPQP